MSTETSLERLKKSIGLGNKATSEAPRRPVAVQPAFYDFSQFPEYREYETMLWYFDTQKYRMNQFLPHVGPSDATVMLDGREVISFSSYNYLGLANDARLKEAAKQAIDDFGTSTGSGRMLTGEVSLHQQFERELCDALGTEDAVVSVGGYSTNAFTIGYLCRPQDLIIYDELVHNSALAGCKLTPARRFSFPHEDHDALERLLAQHRGSHERTLILVEGAYSMDGDIPNLPRLIEIKKKYNALLMVDEAHSMGVIGDKGMGVTDYFGIPAQDIDILYGSMSKSFGTCGGYVAGPKPLITILKHYAPGVLLYGAAPTPANTAAGLAALRIMRAEPERARRVRENAAYFVEQAKAAGLDTFKSEGTGIVPVMMRDSELAVWMSITLLEQGICAFPMIFPIVPRDKIRLRFFLNTNHTREQIDYTIECLAKNMATAPKSKGLI
jgi:8-amino-7-oxononanoate synthase